MITKARIFVGREKPRDKDIVVVFYSGEYTVLYYNTLGVDVEHRTLIKIIKQGFESNGLLSMDRVDFYKAYKYQHTIAITEDN